MNLNKKKSLSLFFLLKIRNANKRQGVICENSTCKRVFGLFIFLLLIVVFL